MDWGKEGQMDRRTGRLPYKWTVGVKDSGMDGVCMNVWAYVRWGLRIAAWMDQCVGGLMDGWRAEWIDG